ncbi:MAG: hypothetical protein WBF47_00955, partial [Xanthobacteraceae bacterium]
MKRNIQFGTIDVACTKLLHFGFRERRGPIGIRFGQREGFSCPIIGCPLDPDPRISLRYLSGEILRKSSRGCRHTIHELGIPESVQLVIGLL